MTHPEMELLIARLEAYAARAPRRYQLQVGLLACLGYAFLMMIILGLLMVAGSIIAVMALPQHPLLLLKLLIAPLALLVTLIESLKIAIPEPQGLELRRGDAPALFALLDDLREKLNSPAFHRVLLTRDMNASVLQLPRLGIFGWQRNFLMIGLPLMQGLTQEQFRAVMAHEVAHLSGNHSWFSGRIHRVRLTWLQVLENLHRAKHRKAAAWGRRFFEWYIPYFSAYSFVLARQQEYAADRCAAEQAGVLAAAQALVAIRVRSRFCDEEFWPDVNRQVQRTPQPPPLLPAFVTALQSPLPPGQAHRFFEEALSRAAGVEDTHPALKQRLSAINGGLDFAELLISAVPDDMEQNAGRHFLGAALPHLLERLEQDWQQQVSTDWGRRYQRVQEDTHALAALNEKARSEPLTLEEAWQQAQFSQETGNDETAQMLFRQLAADHPDNVNIHMALGCILIKQDNAEGLTHLEAAMRLEAGATRQACEVAAEFCSRHGKNAEAVSFQDKAKAHRRVLILAHEEREAIENNCRFEAHGLPPEAVEALVQQIEGFRGIKSIYLVRKKVTHLPEHPLYVLWLVPPFITQTKPQDILKQIAPRISFPGQMQVLVADGSDLRILKIRRTLPQARIHQRRNLRNAGRI